MPHEASAAMYQGLADRSLRCAYHAKVMNTFEAASMAAVSAKVPMVRFCTGIQAILSQAWSSSASRLACALP